MRTAVVRVDVDPTAALSAAALRDGTAELRDRARDAGVELIDADISAMPKGRRVVELLIDGTDPELLKRDAIALCASVFGTAPEPGVLTFISRGTDDDAAGVLAGFGLSGQIEREPGGDGWDVVTVTLRREDLTRIPESRIHTALEASLNCEVRIVVS